MNHDSSQKAVNRHFDERAASYGEQSERGAWRAVREMELKAVLAEISPLAGLGVLEVGCGHGWYASRIAPMGPSLYAVTDMLFSMTAAVAAQGVKKAVADLAHLPVKPVFDRVLCAGALEFVPDPAPFFREASLAIKPGGRIVLLAPSTCLAGKAYRWWHRRHGFSVNLFGLDYIKRMAQANGLEVRSARRGGLFNLAVSLEKKQ
ncbi:MAG: class I SAM-dependent methyltransferase [Nitrospinae bacterium]|nr:class I SAM-dependent methyltransferase [Nitrospinota bacterium]